MGQLFTLFKQDVKEKAINAGFTLWKDLFDVSIYIGVIGGMLLFVAMLLISHYQLKEVSNPLFLMTLLTLELSLIGLNIFKAVGMYYFSLKRRAGEYKEEAHK